MKRVAMMCATGFEAGETLLVVDVLRWAGIEVDLVSLGEREVTGMHGIITVTDRVFGEDIVEYDMLVIPGGGCANELMGYEPLKKMLKKFGENHQKLVAGICSGLRVLKQAGLLTGKKITYRPTEENQLQFAESIFVDEIVVQDGNLITSRGPGMSFAFAYELVRALGEDAETLKDSMQYTRTKQSRL